MRVVWQGVSFPANRTHGVTFHRPAGVLTVAMRVVWQEVSFPANRTHGVTFHRPDGTLRAPLFGLQGGGVYVDSNGVANFEGCNIHDNNAFDVVLASLNFP